MLDLNTDLLKATKKVLSNLKNKIKYNNKHEKNSYKSNIGLIPDEIKNFNNLDESNVDLIGRTINSVIAKVKKNPKLLDNNSWFAKYPGKTYKINGKDIIVDPIVKTANSLI
tara:strand:+ start:426 stop:761 length:336 start_codon:yes stop_codon:yes gene_type:complete